MIADTNISMLKCHKLDVGVKEVGELINMFPTDDGGFISSVDIEYPSHIYLVKVSYEGVIQWKRKFDYPGEQEINVIRPTADKGVVGIAEYNSNSRKTWIFKTDSLGLTPSCFVAEPFAAITHPTYTVTPSGFSTISFTLPVYTINSPNVSGVVPVVTVCENTIVPSCSTLSIAGQDSVCNINNNFSYKANKSSGCSAPVTWQTDTSFATITAANDATITIKYKKKGITKIIASIATACETVNDTLTVRVFAAAAALSLGPDLTFCNIKQATLMADSGYQTYLWNDGSKGRSLIAASTGKYFVTVNDVCNQSYSDTVNITSSSDLSFNVGRNLKRCNNDTLVKSIASGYTSYKWSPSVGLSDTTTNAVKIFNQTDMVYLITVLREPGCYLTDSFKVSHYRSAMVGLRADTSICAGTFLSLSPANTFKVLTWSTGEITNAITVSRSGTYSVLATDSNACVSKDTFQLLNVYPLPHVNLGGDTSICHGSTFVVNAGSFSSYLWQDNSSNSTFSVKTTGTYWVKVTDNNSCIISDTIIISRLKEPTTNFLPHEIKICEGEIYVLKPTAILTNWRWSTNESSPTISISKPGYYSLSATNNEGCTSDDTTRLAYNDCSKFIYFPTAFTPNNDSKNDVFKPTAFAPVNIYHLVIYNRFGQKVFETTNFTDGWDGKLKGQQQDTGTFVYLCEYRFFGVLEVEQIRKGSLVLIR